MVPVVIDKDGWRDVKLEEGFAIPAQVHNAQAFIMREKIIRYVATHPHRLFYYSVDGMEYVVDCKAPRSVIEKKMKAVGSTGDELAYALNISQQLKYFNGKLCELSQNIWGKHSPHGNVLEERAEELLDMFGRLYTVEEVQRVVVEDWGFATNVETIRFFYTRHLKEIERLRDQYSLDYSDLALTKKRARVDKLSIMFYTYYNKWNHDNRLDYAKQCLALLEAIKKEVEGELININVQGQINVDMTLEANKTLAEVHKRVPINNMILGLVAAKRGIDPTVLMAQLTTSHYRALTGYGQHNPDAVVTHPVDLTYNWNDITAKHRQMKGIEDAKIVTSTGTVENDAKFQDVRTRLLAMLNGERGGNERRRTK